MIVGVDSSPLGATDAGRDREYHQDFREALCCARMPGNRFCTKDDGHDGQHGSEAPERDIPVSDFGPEASKKRRY